MRLATALPLLLILAIVLAGCLPGHVVYASGPYEGRVVDIETKQPLAGAAVVAVWYQEAAIFGGHGPAHDPHDALEVVTDARGEFVIPAKTHFTLIGRILNPKFIVYYPGYAPYPELGTSPHGDALESAYKERRFLIELPKLKTREERLKHATIPVAVDGRIPEEQIRNLLRLVNQERRELDLQSIGQPVRR